MIKNEESVVVYVGNEIRGAGTPIVVTTISFQKFKSFTFIGEFYIFLRGKENKFIDKIITYELCRELEELEKIDRDFMEKEIFGRAKEELSLYLNEVYGKTQNPHYLQSQYVLEKTEEKELMGIWFSGKFNDEIVKISKSKNCRKLKKLLQDYQKFPYLINT